MSEHLHFRNYADLVRDTMKLAPHLRDVDAIVGIPRSGMLPATILATALHKRVALACGNGAVTEGWGDRMWPEGEPPPPSERCVVIDDSVLTGKAMKWAAGDMSRELSVRACVYCHPDATEHVDHYAALLPSPRVFEWNLFGSELIKHSLLDIDGVLCPDPPMPEDDWNAYCEYLASAPVLHKPLHPVAGIVTNRCESVREITETWLAHNGIQYGTLRMAPFSTAGARRRMSTPWDLKSAWYSVHNAPGVLVESHDHIAETVARAVNRPVISLQSMRCYQ